MTKRMDFGSKEWNEYYGLRHGSRVKPDQAKRAGRKLKAATSKRGELAEAAKDPRNAELNRQARTEAAILGPDARTRAIKLIPRHEPFRRADLVALQRAGWEVYPAGSVPSRVGTALPALEATRNPADLLDAILGREGQARAVILALPEPDIDKRTLDEFRRAGYDVAAAPRRYRDGITRNPSPTPAAIRAAEKKAAAWYRKANLVTAPQTVAWKAPEAAVAIGQIVAIEYLSDKFDGIKRVYRHEVTHERDLFISPNGDTLIVLPGFKVTTRGIEG